jgi:hypothetical protein
MRASREAIRHLANVASASIDATRACLAGESVAYDVTSDGPATLALSDGRKLDLPAGRAQGTLPARR